MEAFFQSIEDLLMDSQSSSPSNTVSSRKELVAMKFNPYLDSPLPIMARISRLFPMKTTCTLSSCEETCSLRQLLSRAQYTVLTKHLGVTKIHCIVGFSMGGQQVDVSSPQNSGSSPRAFRHITGRRSTLTLLSALSSYAARRAQVLTTNGKLLFPGYSIC